jgi:hypothetical protein
MRTQEAAVANHMGWVLFGVAWAAGLVGFLAGCVYASVGIGQRMAEEIEEKGSCPLCPRR